MVGPSGRHPVHQIYQGSEQLQGHPDVLCSPSWLVACRLFCGNQGLPGGAASALQSVDLLAVSRLQLFCEAPQVVHAGLCTDEEGPAEYSE